MIQGIAIGRLQISGLGQIIVLAICEITLIVVLALNRQGAALWKSVALPAVRLMTIVMSCAFLPAVGLSEGTKGYLGYAILSLHALALVLGFLLTSVLDLVKFVLGTVDPERRPHSAPVCYHRLLYKTKLIVTGIWTRPIITTLEADNDFYPITCTFPRWYANLSATHDRDGTN